MAGLTGHGGNEVEVSVVVKDDDIELLRCGSDQQIGDLAASLTGQSEEPLHLERPAEMPCCRIDRLEGLQRSQKLVPFLGVTGGVSDFKVANTAASDLAGCGCRPYSGTDMGTAEPFENAGIDEKSQRHASERSSSRAAARTFRAAATRSCR